MKQFLTFLMLFITGSFIAQGNKDKKYTIEGSIDTYYRTNLTAPNGINQIAPSTSFADKSGFSLGMGNIIAQYEKGKVGAVADFVFGPRGEAASTSVINQLYVFYKISKTTTLSAGKFNTYLGYELIAPTGNFNYSTSYMFTNGPFNHTGLKADFTFSEDFNMMLGVFNQTDINNYNPDGSYAVGSQFGYKNQYLNLLYDKAGLGFEIDYTGSIDLTKKLFLGINTAYADNEGEGFYGAALYPQYEWKDSFKLGLRGEYFSRISNVIANESSIFTLTLTGSYVVDELTIKPEIRLDNGSKDFFIDNDLMPTKSLASFLVAAIYKFN